MKVWLAVMWLGACSALAAACGGRGEAATAHADGVKAHTDAVTGADSAAVRTPSGLTRSHRHPTATNGSASAVTAAASAPASAAQLAYEPGARVKLRVPADRPIELVHGQPGVERVIVYLHGVCGNPQAPASWERAASRFGSLLVLLGDEPCPKERGRFKWSADHLGLDRRIERALAVVEAARGEPVARDRLALFGYSQGAYKAQRLHQRKPLKYPWLVLASTPIELVPSELRSARTAVLAGEREYVADWRRGAEALVGAGLAARLFVLPGGVHGSYGTDPVPVIEAALGFLFER